MSLLKSELLSQIDQEELVLSREALLNITLDEIFILLHIELSQQRRIKFVELVDGINITHHCSDYEILNIYNINYIPDNSDELCLLLCLYNNYIMYDQFERFSDNRHRHYYMYKIYTEDFPCVEKKKDPNGCGSYWVNNIDTDNHCYNCSRYHGKCTRYENSEDLRKILIEEKNHLKQLNWYELSNYYNDDIIPRVVNIMGVKHEYSKEFIKELKLKIYEYNLPIEMLTIILSKLRGITKDGSTDNMNNFVENYLRGSPPKSARNV